MLWSTANQAIDYKYNTAGHMKKQPHCSVNGTCGLDIKPSVSDRAWILKTRCNSERHKQCTLDFSAARMMQGVPTDDKNTTQHTGFQMQDDFYEIWVWISKFSILLPCFIICGVNYIHVTKLMNSNFYHFISLTLKLYKGKRHAHIWGLQHVQA